MELPWCDYLNCMPTNSSEKLFYLIFKKKQGFSMKTLADRYQMSRQFGEIAFIIDNMHTTAYPNYSRINRLLREVLEQQSEPQNRVFQWKRVSAHNKYSMVKIMTDEQLLLQLDAECKCADSLDNVESVDLLEIKGNKKKNTSKKHLTIIHCEEEEGKQDSSGGDNDADVRLELKQNIFDNYPKSQKIPESDLTPGSNSHGDSFKRRTIGEHFNYHIFLKEDLTPKEALPLQGFSS